MGSQSPRRPILRWSATDKLGLLMVCLLVAIFSSYKLLAVPDLKPGDIAQVNVIAPRDAKVIDTTDLKEKKQGLKESFIQSIDKNKSFPGMGCLKFIILEPSNIISPDVPDKKSSYCLSNPFFPT